MSAPVVIGNATLYLGDARTICAGLPDRCADMIFTDPPYGHNNNNGDLIDRREEALGRGPKGEARPIANDSAEEAHELAEWLFVEAPRLLASGGCCCCCCCCGGGPDPQFARWSLMMNASLDFKQMVVWDKGPMGMGWHYRRSYETVLVGQKRGGACKWYDTSDKVENIIRAGMFGVRKIIPQADDHPTPKPSALARHFIRLHTLEGETVLDPFMGHGSTGEGAVREGRRFIGCEIDPLHFDVACRRIEMAQRQGDLFLQAGT
jgi:DNA modification methylase